MTDPAISPPYTILVPPAFRAAYEAAGWTVVNPAVPWCHEDEPRVLLRWEREGEPVIPGGAK